MQIQITTNAKNVAKKLGTTPERLAGAMSRAIRKSAFLVERGGKTKSPVDTGRMRSSISASITSVRAVIQPNVDYAIFVHEGTRFMRARPFMKEGLREAEGEIERVFKNEIVSALK